jgi:hypothetical protein
MKSVSCRVGSLQRFAEKQKLCVQKGKTPLQASYTGWAGRRDEKPEKIKAARGKRRKSKPPPKGRLVGVTERLCDWG